MKFERIQKDTYRAFKKVSGYVNVYRATQTHVDEKYAEKFYANLAQFFKCTPLIVMQSLYSVGLFDPEVNKDKDKARLFAEALWRMCANKDLLKNNAAVLPYRAIAFPEDVEAKIVNIDTGENNRVYSITAQILTGHFAPGIVNFKLSYDGLQLLLSRIGYNYNRYPAPNMLTAALNTYVQLHIKPANGIGSRVVEDILENKDVQAYNRKNILKFRCGLEPCQRHFNWSCDECESNLCCPASYSLDGNRSLF